MKLTIDTDARTLAVADAESAWTLPLYSNEAFDLLSREWLKVGWNQKYSYTFTWLGRPIIQNPEDLVRAQEVIASCQPDVIIETGVAHGGSLILYASLCKLLGKGRVVGIDIEIRPHNRKAIEAHPLSSYITLIEGSSIDPSTVAKVKSTVKPGETAMVILDSCHAYAHVMAELEAYCGLVTAGQYLVSTDGIMQDLYDVPRGAPEWKTDNPAAAARDFAAKHPEFVLEQPPWKFNESPLSNNVTTWPDAWLRRRGADHAD